MTVDPQDFQSYGSAVQREPWEEESHDQNPKVLFITCSDLPITSDILSRCGPGELFMMQNPGNFVPPYTYEPNGEAATIEYALQILRVSHIVVCGHSPCGAISCLMNPEDPKQLPALRNWLTQALEAKRLIQKEFGHLEGESLVDQAIGENIRAQLDNLQTHPKVVERLSLGAVKLHGWMYHIESRDLWFYDFEAQEFFPLADFPLT